MRRPVSLPVLIVSIAFFGQISAIFAQETAGKAKLPSADEIAKSNITYNIIVSEGGGYGYDVFTDGIKIIHQPTIPGQPGITGFRTKSDSEKVAELVIRKLKNRETPPAITEEELKKLKVID